MGLSKSNRIIILLAIDSAFFLLELVVGYAVHSLALVADSFHMLNDVLSLCVGYWAVKVASQKATAESRKKYTYGWQRAETLGALVNGVFLVALCLSIFLEAIQRFVEPQTVSNPKLVLIVGCFGLLSNILGLFLFHEHGHSHSGEGHKHSEEESEETAVADHGREAVHGTTISTLGRYLKGSIFKRSEHQSDDPERQPLLQESDSAVDVLPESRIGEWPKTVSATSEIPNSTARGHDTGSKWFTRSDEDGSTAASTTSPLPLKKSNSNATPKRHRRHTSGSRSRYSRAEEIHVHPASFRNDIIAASRLEAIESGSPTESEGEDAVEDGDLLIDDTSSFHQEDARHSSGKQRRSSAIHSHSLHTKHKHNQPKIEKRKGDHGDLNMQGVFLHVMGDALGNIGVIASALFIWLTDYSWRFYSDPAISLVITIIILGSAIPLCRAASRILLQAVPAGLNVDDIKEDIEELPGIAGCHHLHVWQLSDTKMVASLHIQLNFDFKGEGSARYMQLAQQVNYCLHQYGIHSSTIQPEFCLDDKHNHVATSGSNSVPSEADHSDGNSRQHKASSKQGSKTASVRSGPDNCLLDCGIECSDGNQCCGPTAAAGSGHDHSHAH